jgi:GT2 family glycosyltransferase
MRDVPSWEYPVGANVAFRVAPARRHGGFSPRFGHRGRRLLQHEGTDLCLRLDRAGEDIVYVPDAVVDHWVLAERLTPAFFLRRHWLRGQSGALCELRNRGLRPALKLLRWFHGRHLLAAPYRPGARVDSTRLLAACRQREAAGYLVGLARGALAT